MSGLFPTTSTTLLGDLRKGSNAPAWGRFIADYRPGIVRACRAAGIGEATAEDLAQDVLLKVVMNLDTFDPKLGRFRAWLNAVIRNTVRDHRKSAWVRKARQVADGDDGVWLDQLADSITAGLDEGDRLALHVAIDRVRATVSDNCYEAFRRRHVDGEKVEDVASALNVSEGNVRVLALRFRTPLGELLESMGLNAE